MPVKFILDKREKHLEAVFRQRNISFESKQLDLGDILILYTKEKWPTEELTAAERVLLGVSKDEITKDLIHTITIERKTYLDLMSSMTDGRYREQKSRYKSLPRGSVYYILENNDPKFETLGKAQFWGAYLHTMIRDQIGVLLSSNLEETVDMLHKIGNTLEEFGVELSAHETCSVERSQIRKKKAQGQEQIWRLQLSCVPGISVSKAELIAKNYPSYERLITALRDNSFIVKGVGPKLKLTLLDAFNEPETNIKSKLVFK